MGIFLHGIVRRVTVLLTLMLMASPVFSAERKPSVVAVVDGSEIHLEEFNRESVRVQRLVLGAGRPLTCSEIGRIRTEVVEALVRRELLYQESKKRGIRVEQAEIDGQIAKLKERYATEGDFANALAVMKISPDSLRAKVERTLAIQRIIEKEFASRAAVTDQEIWRYYDGNRDSFRRPEQIRAAHILIKAGPPADAAKKTEAREKIEKIQEEIRSGKDFEALAKSRSEDPSGAKGGDLGYIQTGQVVKPFEEALFALKPGEVSGIVETDLGFHLIKGGDRKPETTIPFETVKDQIRTLLKQEKGQEEANRYIKKARETAKVEIFLAGEK